MTCTTRFPKLNQLLSQTTGLNFCDPLAAFPQLEDHDFYVTSMVQKFLDPATNDLQGREIIRGLCFIQSDAAHTALKQLLLTTPQLSLSQQEFMLSSLARYYAYYFQSDLPELEQHLGQNQSPEAIPLLTKFRRLTQLTAQRVEQETTTSEKLFENFCQQNGLELQRIPASLVAKTPDYHLLTADKQEIWVEIKEKNDSKVLDAPPRKSLSSASANVKQIPETIGSHRYWERRIKTTNVMGSAFYKSMAQLAKYTTAQQSGPAPLLTVFYDNRQEISPTQSELDPHVIDFLMYGNALYRADGTLARSHNPNVMPVLSAVCLMKKKGDELYFEVYHNREANQPLPRNLFPSEKTKQFIKTGDVTAFGWTELKPAR